MRFRRLDVGQTKFRLVLFVVRVCCNWQEWLLLCWIYSSRFNTVLLFFASSHFVLFSLPLNRKKSKPPPSLIQISSKSCLSSWSKPTFRPKSNSATEGYTNESSVASRHRSRLGSLSKSLSDSCLVKRGLDDLDEFKVSSSSAPRSFSGSSESDDEDDDSGETDDMDHYDPSVNNATQGSDVVVKMVANGVPGNEAEIVPGSRTTSAEAENKNVELGPTKEELHSERSSNEGETSKECRFAVGDEAEGVEPADEREMGFLGEEGVSSRKTTPEDFDCNKQQLKEATELNAKGKEEINYSKYQENQIEQGEVTIDQTTVVKAKKKSLEEHGDNSELSAAEHDAKSLPQQANGEIKSKNDTSFQGNIEDHQISFHGTTASMRVSHSSVELGTMASPGSVNNGDRSPERRRFGARFPGNRGLKIFATAQARGRTLIPELRSKLSSFSQQVRSRSPRLSPRRPSAHNEPKSELKQLRRKCRTKIIEL